MKRLLLSVFVLATSLAQAQVKPQAGKESVYFPYAFAKRTDGRLKVLLISTHLLVVKRSPSGYADETGMHLQFGEMAHQIETDERQFNLRRYDNVEPYDVRVNRISTGVSGWSVALEYGDGILTSDNTLQAAEKSRNNLIAHYEKQGYEIYQVNFTPDTSKYASFRYYDKSSSRYLPIIFERRLALDPIRIPPYRKGQIKQMLASIGSSLDRPDNRSTGLVISSSSSEEKKEQKKESNSSGSEEKKKTEDIDWEARVSAARMESEVLEAQGDELYRQNVYNMPAALAKYEEAYRVMPNPRLKMKIDNINAWQTMGKSIVAVGDALERGIQKADPEGKTRAMTFGLNYTGLATTYTDVANTNGPHPMATTVNITGHRLCFSFEVRFGYFVMPTYEYNTSYSSYGNEIVTTDKVQVQGSGAGIGLSGGLNIPLKKAVIYGLYGIDVPNPIGAKIITPGYTFREKEAIADLIYRWTFGLAWQVPKTNIGIGLQYNLNKVNGEQDGATSIRNEKYPQEYYYLKRTTSEVYRYNNVGLTFYFKFER